MNKLVDKILKQVEKPGRYIGGEYGEILKNKEEMKARWAFCFPDSYEIGMSNLGVRLLYGVLNEMPDVWCERVYAPWIDMEEKMREQHIPLWALESGDPLTDFDIVAFTLQYEMCYTNVLNMLELAGIPLLAAERGEDHPIVIGGGPCAYNAEPVADFFDIFSIGEGEEALPELTRLYIKMKEQPGYTKEKFLREAAKLEGFYVPSLYEITYREDGAVAAITPKYSDVPAKITKRIVADLDHAYYPDKLILPYIETVHNRTVLETFRGCIRGCRFCQAGMVYRPVREKSPETLEKQAKTLTEATGFDEISLMSLSISDYSRLPELLDRLVGWTNEKNISLSLPSQRADAFTPELMEKISSVRQSGLTFAPEAGTQRLRDAINKNLYEKDLMNACNIAFDYGKSSVKLYFMSGLPTETDEDIRGIGELAERVVDLYYKNPNRKKGIHPKVTISVSCFIPKPFTPFQWEAQCDFAELERKQKVLAETVTNKHIRYTWHDARVSFVEAVFSKGNRRLSAALLQARKMGMRFDSWDEFFSFDRWMECFAAAGIDPHFYANREMAEDEVLPWDMIDCGVSKSFFLREKHRAYASETTENCRDACSGCGASTLGGDCTWCPGRSV